MVGGAGIRNAQNNEHRESSTMNSDDIKQIKEILCSSYQEHVNNDIRDIWREINGMKKMIMTAMAGVILQVVVFVGAVVLVLMQRGHL